MMSFLFAFLQPTWNMGGRAGYSCLPLLGCCPFPPSLWQSFGRLTSLLDCELLKGRDRALCPCVISFWHRKVSIKVWLLCIVF